MTCPALRPCTATDVLGDLGARVGCVAGHVGERLRRDDAVAQFARFVLVGGVSSTVYVLLFAALSASLGSVPANVLASAISSVLANELHRRLTFRAEQRVDWLTAQWEGGVLAAAGIVATSVALGWLSSAGPTDVVAQLLLVGVVTGTIGLLRFVGLRWLFDAPRPART